MRASGVAEIEAHEVGMAVLPPLRELDEVAYLRFASVYRAFDDLEAFEAEIALLRAEHELEPTRDRASPTYERTKDRLEVRRGGPPSGLSVGADVLNQKQFRGGAGMTETSQRQAPGGPAGRARAKGLTIERIYTTPGVHPYDEVTWERRDVVQQNWKTGETIFEQRGVEFPDFWSVNASTIVTTKYFRGAVGTDARESGLKQLIDRVVLTYRRPARSTATSRRPPTPRSSSTS